MSRIERLMVSAANGRTGRHVINALRSQRGNLMIRGFARSACELADETVVGDLEDPAARLSAVDGMDAVIHYAPPMHPRETAMGTGMIDAAAKAGVKRFIYISVIHPQIDDLLNHKAKLSVEAHLINSDLDWTIVRPQHYMQTVDVNRAVESRVVVLPYSPEVTLGHVDLLDVAEAVAKVALNQGHAFAAYDLSSDERMSLAELCATISRAGQTSVVLKTVDAATIIDQIRAHWLGDFSSYTLEGFHRLFGYYSRHGIRGNAAHLRMLLGREPNDFNGYVRRSLTSVPS